MSGRWLPEPQRLPYRHIGPMAERRGRIGSGSRQGGGARVTSSSTSIMRPRPSRKDRDHCHHDVWGGWGVVFGQAEKTSNRRCDWASSSSPFVWRRRPCRSHDPALNGRIRFTLPIQELRILSGAGFLTAVCSGIQLMPGLPKKSRQASTHRYRSQIRRDCRQPDSA